MLGSSGLGSRTLLQTRASNSSRGSDVSKECVGMGRRKVGGCALTSRPRMPAWIL